MIRRPPISTRTDTLFPYTTLFRSYAESNENLVPYGLLKHVHMPEMARTIERLSGGSAAGLVFTPHLVPMTRGVLATIYCRGRTTTDQCLEDRKSTRLNSSH